MTSNEEEFLQVLRATFRIEAAEHLQEIAAGLMALEKAATPESQRPIVERVFRAAHSLKGAARAVNYSAIETLCQSLEDVFAGWKSGKVKVSPAGLDAAHRTLDQVSAEYDGPPGAAPAASTSSRSSAAAPPVTTDKSPAIETVRIDVAKLDARLLEAEELITAKLAADQRAIELGVLLAEFEPWHRQWVRVASQSRNVQGDSGQVALTEFFEWSHDYLRSLQNRIANMRRAAEQDRLSVGKMVDDLLEDSKKLRMLPFSTLGALFPKVVRDLCRDQGKQAELVVRGDDVEIDKRILEEIKDPLIHLLRNCVDHGIETPEQRVRHGKPTQATITLQVSSANGSRVNILVSDDGAGIDVERLKASAAKRGLLPAANAPISESELLALVFEPDVSTSAMVTQLSGRGLGLAIVREKTEKLGGHVSVESRRRVGTTFRISLPVTVATFRGILVGVADRLFVLPTSEVERAIRFKSADVQTVEGRETLAHGGRAISMVRLADVLQLPVTQAASSATTNSTPAVVLGAGEHRIAFAVDTVLDEQELLIRQFAKPLVPVRNIAGASVLGTGQVAPVLRVSDLLESAKRAGAPVRVAPAVKAARAAKKSIMVAEDSITSRLLLKGILEAAGYSVTTAIDGMDALTGLRSGQFDLLISDVEMPRLNGFDLTSAVRADRRLSELPVILVTALETRDDREHGIEAGANAYLVKSSFDQSNLLETVRRLI